MKKSISSVLGILTIFTVSAETVEAQVLTARPNLVRVGVYYDLTPKMAKKLNIDLNVLKKEWAISENEKIVFKLQEDGGLDLSIYENPTYGSLRADGLQK